MPSSEFCHRHTVPGKVVHGEVADVEAGKLQAGQGADGGGAEEHDHVPVPHEVHLALQVERPVLLGVGRG